MFPVLCCAEDPLPAESVFVTDIEQPVKIRMRKSGPGADKPLTIHDLFASTVTRLPHNLALRMQCFMTC